MNVKTYRAKTMQEALALVRNDLGSKASVLRTREIRPRGLSRLWSAVGMIEVVASANVSVPSRLPSRQPIMSPVAVPATHAGLDLSAASSEVRLPQGSAARSGGDKHEPLGVLSQVLAELLATGLDESYARELITRVRRLHGEAMVADSATMRQLLAAAIEKEIRVAGPISTTPGQRRLVALVGPTGVGKTTTLAKLAAHYRVFENRRIGLITCDTYRVAAVEQLRTYADIIDVPLEIASTPREVKQAVARMSDVDLVLMDTAGRSPHDAARIQQLNLLLSEAAPDEVHLVLSSAANADGLCETIERFAPARTTALLLTKLDEVASLGSVFNVIRRRHIPLSYLTYGQDVPADIVVADPAPLARAVVGLVRLAGHQPPR